MLKPSKKQVILITLTLALGLGLIGCGKGPDSSSNQNANINDSAWITYQDKFYGFELKYPKEWGENWEGKVSISNSGYELCFKSKFYLDKEREIISPSASNIFCISRISKKRWNEQQDKNSLGRLLAESNGYILYLIPQKTNNDFVLVPAPTAEKVEEILSTFKLIDQGFSTTDSNAPISIILGEDGWKTYTNKYWGVRFRFEDKDNEILLQASSGKNDAGIQFYKPGETTKEDMYIYINKDKFSYSQDYIYSGTLKEFIENSLGWLGQNDTRLVSYEKLDYPNINEIYKVIVESRITQRVNPKIVRGERIFMLNQNDANEYFYIYDYSNPIIKQILLTFEFLNKK